MRNKWLRGIAVLAGLIAVVAAEVFLRRTLEQADKHLYSFLEYFYPAAEDTLFHGHVPLWKLFLPIPELTGAWSSSIVITHLVEMRIGVANTWYLFNALLVVVSFATAWLAFESAAFSLTFAICMGFGTHFYHTYLVTGGMGSPLIAMAFEVLLLCAYRFIVSKRRAVWWGAAFALSAVWTALTYEGWLDFVAFACVATGVLAVVLRRPEDRTPRRRLLATAAVLVALAAVYAVIKTRLGLSTSQTLGSEADVVFNYHLWAPAIEDVVSNMITNLYMAATNFLPPSFLSSTALFELGADRLVALQQGYHAPYSYLVPMHYLFLWRYAAGAVALAASYLFLTLAARTWREPTADRIAVLVFLIMMIMAGSTHALVKIRPMNTVLTMGYHVLVGVMGAALLIAYGVMAAWRDWRGIVPRVAVTAGVWGLVFYGALARPIMLNHLTAETGVPGLYPNPMNTLRGMLGLPPDSTGDLSGYRLTKYGAPVEAPAPPPAVVTFSDSLQKLPTPAPDLKTWDPGPNVKLEKTLDGFTVQGNTTGGYQLMSPPIPVPPGRQVLVKATGTIEHGRICLGALRGDQQKWLFPASGSVSEFLFDMGTSDAFRLVFDGCQAGADAPRFHVRSMSYAVINSSK